MVPSRNFATYNLNSKQFKDATYVNEKFTEFWGVLNELTVANVLEPKKDHLKAMVSTMATLHPLALQKLST